MGYRKALEKLEALEDKRLESRAYFYPETGCFCAIGALAPEQAQRLNPEFGGAGIEYRWAWDVFGGALEELGLTRREAAALQEVNDSSYGTRADRYVRVVEWLREKVKEEGDGV